METLHGHFIRAFEAYASEPLFRLQQGTLTYADVVSRVAVGIERLHRFGFKRGDRIVCFTDQTIPLGLFILTAGFMRVIPAAISPVFSPQYLKTLCKTSGARAVYVTPEFVHVVQDIGLPVIVYGGALGTKVKADPHTHNLIFDEAAGMSATDSHAILRDLGRMLRIEDALLIQPTSGSCGNPKLVLRNHLAFSRYAEFVGHELRRGLPSGGRFRMLLANALTHAFGCHMFATALRFGAEIALPDELDTRASLESVRDLDPEVLPMTPRILRSLIRQHEARGPGGKRLFGPSARVYLTAGGPSDVPSLQRLRAEGVEPIEFYGSSEASVVAVTPYGRWRPGCAGVPVADVSLKFCRNGELLVNSPGLMLGYHGDQDPTDVVIDEAGFLRTGDIGRLDERGYLRISGRRRDVFNTPEGSNIYPERIEIRLESFEWVEQAFLVGDGRPFLSAHLVVRPERIHDKLGIAPSIPIQCKEGMLPPRTNEALYRFVGQEISRLNQSMELIERVVAIALYDSAFTTEAYKTVTAGKVQRNRTRFLELYRTTIEPLYSDLQQGSPMLVPPDERRYRTTSFATAIGGSL
jgi:long-subunit acyl-CoA synthetase (AMP-forming)